MGARLPGDKVEGPVSPNVELPAVSADLAPIRRALHLVQTRLRLASSAVAAGQPETNVSAEFERMTAARRSEFTAGRVAAAAALRDVGWRGDYEVPSDPRGVPLFPNGFVGSIAHKQGRAVAVVGVAASTHGVGLDLEFDEALHESALASEVLSENEQTQLAQLRSAHPSLMSPATLVLAAKEALFKAVFPIGRVEFDFADAELNFDGTTRVFRAMRFPDSANLGVHGAYEIDQRWIVAAAIATRKP